MQPTRHQSAFRKDVRHPDMVCFLAFGTGKMYPYTNGAGIVLLARVNIPCLRWYALCPLSTRSFTAPRKARGLFRMTVVFLAYPAYHAIRFTPFFPTPVRKEVPVSGVSGNRVHIEVPDTPRIHPPNLSSWACAPKGYPWQRISSNRRKNVNSVFHWCSLCPLTTRSIRSLGLPQDDSAPFCTPGVSRTLLLHAIHYAGIIIIHSIK